MENKIIIRNNEFAPDESGDYVGKMIVWDKEAVVFVTFEEGRDTGNIVIEKIDWINNNRDTIINAFLEENSDIVDMINEMIEEGDFEADRKISEADVIKALFLNNVDINIRGNRIDLLIDLEAEPDYLLGHLACIEINNDYEIEFGGLNG